MSAEKSLSPRASAAEPLFAFRRTVLSYYHKNGRHTLPWRQPTLKLRHGTQNFDPYNILVSEMMLQQTQVDRVIPKYKSFLKKFPTVHVLAKASLGEVLKEWQGLGYNRRAKFLHEAAKEIVATGWPRSREGLLELPGIGAYTASAVLAFAWNKPEILIETNIRSVFIYHFFPRSKKVSDTQIIRLIVQSLDTKNPREWYWALMDYGTHLKKTLGNASRRSAHHVHQKPFKGSDREVRGAILRLLARAPATRKALEKLPFSKERIQKQFAALKKEGMVVIKKRKISLPN